MHANIADYSVDGKRESTWFVDGVVKYHRTFSSLVNSLVGTGFRIERFLEPIADAATRELHPQYAKDTHKPDFLLVRVAKQRLP